MKVKLQCRSLFRFGHKITFLMALGFGSLTQSAVAQQEEVSLDDLSSFRDPAKSWQVVGEVRENLDKENNLITEEGNGVLVNIPSKKKPGKDLYTTFEHGDMDLELDYMMAKGSNSGIYLQGLYELQLEDSWGKGDPTYANNGGVYARWDENRPEGEKGYEGYAPRQNVSLAPGLWQHLEISYQAPRFDANGNKVQNAKLLRVELNGVTIQEDVELSGPTRGAMSQEETPTGPLRIQGDHGAVAFRNVKLSRYEKPRPELKKLRYSVYEGKFDDVSGWDSLPPEAEGPSVILTSELSNKSRQFLIRYTGTLDVKESGDYTFDLRVPGGSGLFRINNQEVIPLSENNSQGTLSLPSGELPFELFYSKYTEWVQPGLGLAVSGEGLREYLLSDKEGMAGNVVDPILVDANEKPVLRSFMDLPDGPRVTHAISVGSKDQLHYTYDLDHGTIVQMWRGGFLDATPMWHERGDGSSRPRGAVHHFVKEPALAVAKLTSEQEAWKADTAGTSFRPTGYKLDAQKQPTFRYQVYGAQVQDAIRVLENGQGLRRQISVQNPSGQLYMRLAEASNIQEVSKGMYVIGDKDYYLRLEDTGGEKALLRKSEGGQELIIPLKSNLNYSILY